MFFRFLLLINLGVFSFQLQAKVYTLAVISSKEKQEIEARWEPMVALLRRELKEEFSLLPLEIKDIEPLQKLILEKSVDFIIAPPSLSIELEVESDCLPILTLINPNGSVLQGSVLFTRADSALESLKDLSDSTTVAAVSPNAFFGWLIAYDELLQYHHATFKKKDAIHFLNSEERVVESVLNGSLTLGIVKTATLEEMYEHHRLQLSKLKVLNQQHPKEFPYLLSTKLYPDLSLLVAPHIPHDLSKSVTVALLSLKKTALTGHEPILWTNPQNYQSVHELMKRHRIGPYKNIEAAVSKDFFDYNRVPVLLIIMFSLFSFSILVVILFYSQRLRRSRKEANDSFEYFKTLFDTNTNMIVVTKHGRIIHANKSFLSFYHCSNVDEFRLIYKKLISTFDDVDDKEYIKNDLHNGIWIERVFLNPHRKNKVAIKGRHFSVKIHKILYHDDKNYVITFSDITAEINKNSDLAGEISVASNMINEQQRQLKSQAQKAAMGEMISIIAHQLKQPLAAISAMTTNIKIKNELGILTLDICMDLNEKISDDIIFMSSTIDDFRNFFKPNKEAEIYEVTKAIDQVLTLLKPLLDKNHIEVVYGRKALVEVKSFPSELKQVLMNIINNCKDAFLENVIKNPLIKIEVEKDESLVTVRISDNGGGIAAENMPYIFTSYFTTKGAEGTGLGLHMTKMIVEENLQGNINVYNNAEGAVFEIVFPLFYMKRAEE